MNAQPQTDRRALRAQDKRKLRREQILDAAMRVFSERGYYAASVADIIEEAQVSRGTFYLYFEGREAIFHELVDSFIKELVACVQPVALESARPVEELYENVVRIVELLFEKRQLTVILLREAIGINSEVDRKLEVLNSFLLRMVSGALRNGAEWGLTRKVNERIVAMAIIGAVKEVLYQYLVVNHSDPPSREVIAKELLEFGLRGLTNVG